MVSVHCVSHVQGCWSAYPAFTDGRMGLTREQSGLLRQPSSSGTSLHSLPGMLAAWEDVLNGTFTLS